MDETRLAAITAAVQVANGNQYMTHDGESVVAIARVIEGYLTNG